MDYSELVATLRESAVVLAGRVASYLPSVLGALALIVLGWLLARGLRSLVTRLAGKGLGPLLSTRLLAGAEDRYGMRRVVPPFLGGVVFWAVMLVFAAASIDVLGLPAVTSLLDGLARYLPHVLAGVAIFFAGVVLGNLVNGAVAGAAGVAGFAYAGVAGRAAQVAVLSVAVVMAIDQIGIDSTFLIVTIPVLLGTVLGGAALAFGLGSRSVVSNIVSGYYMQKIYGVGQSVRIAGLEGRIVSITPTAVILEGPNGRVAVPARLFSEEPSVLIGGQV